jgi:hypothetical protein
MLKRPLILVLFLLLGFFSGNAFAGWSGQGCTTKGCHAGIEPIMPEDSEMMKQLKRNGLMHGDADGCVVCHGGNPAETKDKDKAHKGVPQTLKLAPGPKEFYPDPASIWVTRYTCAVCHTGYDYRLERAPMNTEAGKISGNLHTWGFEEVADHKVPYGNYDVKDLDGPTPFVGTKEYKDYMLKLIKAYSYIFPEKLDQMPAATPEDVVKDPKKAGLIYQRQECQRCHVGVRGREKRGDYRGMGCGSCHIPYSNEGFYEGNDESINKKEHGHLLVHKIQGTRRTNGIPVETCNSCHNRGKRIGVSYQGLMEFPYGSPYNKDGKKQPKLHTKKYLFIGDDLHHQYNSREGNPKGGLLCQDCHTSIEMHGDGNIHGTTLAVVEIECADCHGSVDKYPWELPLGYQDESGLKIDDKPRGLAKKKIAPEDQFGYQYDPEDGFLLSARGNPLGNVVKRGDKVIVHSATGLDFESPLLKTIDKNNSWKNQEAKVAMKAVKKHMDKMECYTCHSSWVPQCYGCHVKVDLSNGKTNIDWVASGNTPDRFKNGMTSDAPLGVGGTKSAGKAMESRSYLRWEDPVLGYNGENRITPLMPGCQVTYTVIGPDGKTLINNKVEYSYDEAKERGQKEPPLAIDMAPVQPHTSQRKARSCESCHSNPKTVGLGIGEGLFGKYHEDVVEDLIDAKTFKPIPKQYQVQIPAIPQLTFDWSQVVTRDGKQVATVGTHWPLSRPFNKEEIDSIMRTGTCMGCHQNMSEEELWKKVSTDGQLDIKQHLESMNQIIQYLGEKGIKPATLKKK